MSFFTKINKVGNIHVHVYQYVGVIFNKGGPRELVSFDPWHVTHSPPIGRRI